MWLAPKISISGLTRFSEHAQSVRFVRFHRKSVNRGLPFWTGPEVSILNVDQKERVHRGREWSALITAVALSGHVPIPVCNLKASNISSLKPGFCGALVTEPVGSRDEIKVHISEGRKPSSLWCPCGAVSDLYEN